MTRAPEKDTAGEQKYYRYALWLALFTVFYNIVEGLISVYFGLADETLALFGFGIDSFIETVSAAGVTHMVLRIRRVPDSPRGRFETTALKITGTSFYLLSAGLTLTALASLSVGHRPETTFWGVIVASASIATMSLLIRYKVRVGKRLCSAPVLADAGCTRVCLYMSVVLLAASLIYELTGVGYVDAAGTLGLAWFSFREGRESFEKARNVACCRCGREGK